MTRQRTLVRGGLATTPADVMRLVRGLDGVPNSDRPGDGQRNGPGHGDDVAPIRAVDGTLVHLLTVERLTAANLRLAAEQEHAALVDEHAGQSDAPIGASDLNQRVAAFAAARQETLEILDTLPAGGWARPVRHPALATVRVVALARRLLDHDFTHLERLAEQRRAVLADHGPEYLYG